MKKSNQWARLQFLIDLFSKRSRVRAAPEEAAFSFRKAFFGPNDAKEKASSTDRDRKRPKNRV